LKASRQSTARTQRAIAGYRYAWYDTLADNL
jgi:hypothetical protein